MSDVLANAWLARVFNACSPSSIILYARVTDALGAKGEKLGLSGQKKEPGLNGLFQN